MNICSLVIQADPTQLAAVRVGLEQLPGLEIQAAAEDGRLVVTLEDTDQAQAADTLRALHQVHGVRNAMLIYHYGGDEPMQEEIIGESH